MTRNCSRNTFLRQTPNRLLKKYFDRKGLSAEVDFDGLGDTGIAPIAETLNGLMRVLTRGKP